MLAPRAGRGQEAGPADTATGGLQTRENTPFCYSQPPTAAALP